MLGLPGHAKVYNEIKKGLQMSVTAKKHSIFTASALFSSAIGLVAVIFIMIFRTIFIRTTLLAELGSGYISLTAPVINGLDPSTFYRIMHNLTATWSLVLYLLLTTSGVFLASRSSWKPQNIRLFHTIVATVHVAFVVLFDVSLFLPVGTMITMLTK
jgi:hypothetical protein